MQVKFGDGRNLWQLFCFVAFFSWNGAPGKNYFGDKGVFLDPIKHLCRSLFAKIVSDFQLHHRCLADVFQWLSLLIIRNFVFIYSLVFMLSQTMFELVHTQIFFEVF